MNRVVTRTYKSERDFQRDANKLWKRGYTVSSITTTPGRTKLGQTLTRFLLFGLFARPARHHDTYTAVYTHQPTTSLAPSFAAR